MYAGVLYPKLWFGNTYPRLWVVFYPIGLVLFYTGRIFFFLVWISVVLGIEQSLKVNPGLLGLEDEEAWGFGQVCNFHASLCLVRSLPFRSFPLSCFSLSLKTCGMLFIPSIECPVMVVLYKIAERHPCRVSLGEKRWRFDDTLRDTH
jgi:hypothetical protein